MTRLAYDTDLSDDQWEVLAPYLPAAKPGRRPRTLDLREVLNAIFYLLSHGIKGRAMPHDLPRWQSVYTDFRAWERDGTWYQLNTIVRTQLRLQAGRNAQPSAGSVDRPSVKTASGGEDIRFDGGKQVKGRKRTILVDTMGLLLAACVHGAGRSDQRAMTLLATFHAQFWTCLQLIWVDSTFAGKAFIAHIAQPADWLLYQLNVKLHQNGGVPFESMSYERTTLPSHRDRKFGTAREIPAKGADGQPKRTLTDAGVVKAGCGEQSQ